MRKRRHMTVSLKGCQGTAIDGEVVLGGRSSRTNTVRIGHKTRLRCQESSLWRPDRSTATHEYQAEGTEARLRTFS